MASAPGSLLPREELGRPNHRSRLPTAGINFRQWTYPAYKGGAILLAKSGGAGRAAYVAGIGTRSAAEARRVAQAQPDPARARGDCTGRPSRLPQGQPPPQAP